MNIHGKVSENRQLEDFLDEYGSGMEMMEKILEEREKSAITELNT